MNDKEKLHLSHLFEKKLEGELNQAEADELEALTLENPEAAEFYYDLCVQHIGLEEHRQQLEGQKIVPFPRERRNISQKLFPLSLAASLILAITLVFTSQQHREIKPIGILSQVNHCVWAESSLPTMKGSELRPGTMKLEKGIAEIQLNSGVYFQIEAPAHFELLSDMHCIVHTGSIMADVPDRAKGFTIDTPSAKVIDHGTKFIVRHDPEHESSSYVEVLEGEVEVQGHKMKNSQHLFKGDSILASETLITDDLDLERFKNTPQKRETFHLISSVGRGQEATIITTDDYDFHYIPEMILLKNSYSNGLNRKGYLKFDLDVIPNKNFKNVKLSLNMLPTHLGTTLDMTNPVFKVYGLKEEHDSWESSTLRYGNAPGNVKDGNKVDGRQTIYLGSFQLEKGELEVTKTVESEELLSFIRNDQNGLVSLIIIRENSDQKSVNSIVHGFANSKHPSASPPKLIFEY